MSGTKSNSEGRREFSPGGLLGPTGGQEGSLGLGGGRALQRECADGSTTPSCENQLTSKQEKGVAVVATLPLAGLLESKASKASKTSTGSKASKENVVYTVPHSHVRLSNIMGCSGDDPTGVSTDVSTDVSPAAAAGACAGDR